MAIIYISEAEAAHDFAGLLVKVRAGEEVRISGDAGSVAIRRVAGNDLNRKTLSEAIRLAEERGLATTLDDQWSNDLETVIRNHESEAARNLWEE